jgi:hypothetical protein
MVSLDKLRTFLWLEGTGYELCMSMKPLVSCHKYLIMRLIHFNLWFIKYEIIDIFRLMFIYFIPSVFKMCDYFAVLVK